MKAGLGYCRKILSWTNHTYMLTIIIRNDANNEMRHNCPGTGEVACWISPDESQPSKQSSNQSPSIALTSTPASSPEQNIVNDLAATWSNSENRPLSEISAAEIGNDPLARFFTSPEQPFILMEVTPPDITTNYVSPLNEKLELSPSNEEGFPATGEDS